MTASTPVSAVWASLVAGGFAAGAVPFIAADNTPTADIANLFWDNLNKRLNVSTAGDQTGTDPINSYAQHDQYNLQSVIGVNVATPWLSTLMPAFTVSSSRGNLAVNAALQTGDFIGSFMGWGFIPTVLNTPIYTPISGTWSVVRGVDANGNLGGELHFGCKADSGIFADLGFIDSTGVFRPTVLGGMSLGKTAFSFSGLFLQYTASPGTGNQIQNTATGRGSIAVGTAVTVITNSKVSATSIVLVQLESNDATATRLIVTVAGGSFTVTANANATAQTNFSFVVIGN